MRWIFWRHRTGSAAAAPGTSGPSAATGAEPDPADGAAGSPEPVVTLQVLADVPEHCRVAVLGSSGGLRILAAHLPVSWAVEFLEEVGDLSVADLVVLTQPTAGKIASVQVRQPEASVLALAHPAARVDTVVDLLAAGATACVRAGDPALVAAHLLACARRYAVPIG
jgi:hypothetical protein